MNTWREFGGRGAAVLAAAALTVVCAAGPGSADELAAEPSTEVVPTQASAEPVVSAADPSVQAVESQYTIPYELTPTLLRVGWGVVRGVDIAPGVTVSLLIDGRTVATQQETDGVVQLPLPVDLAPGGYDLQVTENGEAVHDDVIVVLPDTLKFNIDGRWFDKATYARTGYTAVVSGAPAYSFGNAFLFLDGEGGEYNEPLPIEFDERGIGMLELPGDFVAQLPVGEHLTLAVVFPFAALAADFPEVTVGAATFVITELGIELPKTVSQAELRAGATARATGYKPGESVRYAVDGQKLGPVPANADSVVAAPLPKDLAPGEHTVTFVSDTGEVSTSFTVTPSAPGVDGPTPPAGSDRHAIVGQPMIDEQGQLLPPGWVHPLDVAQLVDGARGEVTTPATVLQGASTWVHVGRDLAGTEVDVVLNSTPVYLGRHRVGADGRVHVTIPKSTALGDHRIAVYTTSGELIGWAPVEVVASAVKPAAYERALPATGAETSTGLLAAALVAVAGGVTLLARQRRRV